MKLTPERIAALAADSDIKYLTTDSRSVFAPEQTVFAALRTGLADGHRYIRSLIDAGVRTFVVEYIPEDCAGADVEFLETDSVESALRAIARARVGQNTSGIVVTGSRGKTKVKELLYRAMLARGRRVRRSPGSWNSAVGVARSLWDARRDIPMTDNDFAIITEAAIDGPGQAEKIVECIRHSHKIGVITDITSEHDTAFASHADKIREKAAIVAHCDVIFYNDSDPELLPELRRAAPAARLVAVSADALPADCPTVYHALAKAVLGLEHMPVLPLASTRVEISETTNGCTVLRDYFTADVRSLENTLDTMRRHLTPAQTPVLVLGPLVEGTPEQAEDIARRFGVDRIIRVADAATFVAEHPAESFANNLIVVFGQSSEDFDSVAASLRSAAHDTTLEVDLDAIVHNYNYYRSLLPAGTGIIAMVKASAYGMGAVEIGKTLQSHGAAALAVAVVDEGVALRTGGITMPVIVLNPVTNRYPSLFANRLEPAVFSVEELDRLIHEAGRAGVTDYPVHIKLDTGMHRVGFIAEQIPALIERLSRPDAARVRVASVFSHLATADCLDMDAYTEGQIADFNRLYSMLADGIASRPARHLLNTAGMMRFADRVDFERARLGIGLYGIAPFPGPQSRRLATVAALRTTIISLKHWPEGTPIGYGCRGHVDRPSVIATIPIGYADGVNRHFGRGNASFKVRGVECPTVGNICMDLCMIDVTDVPSVSVGDSVEIFGPDMPVECLAEILDTIPYEILTSVSPRVSRTYFRH